MIEIFLKNNQIEYIKSKEENFVFDYDAYLYNGNSGIVILPSNSEQMNLILEYMNSNKICYLIRGAATNYCGAVQPICNEVVISTHKMNSFVNELSEYVYDVSPSTTLYEIKTKLEGDTKTYPPDPASQKICTVGGTIAMNAGGARCYMYGVTENYIREMIVNTPSYGDILLGSNRLYTLANYPLKYIFIGSEGTLGTILKNTIYVQNETKHKEEMIIYFNDYNKAVEFIDVIIENNLMTTAIDMSTDPYVPGKTKIVGAKLIISLESDNQKDILKKKEILLKQLLIHGGDVTNTGKLHEMRLNTVQENITEIMKNSTKKVYFIFDTVVPRSKLSKILKYFYDLADHFDFPILNTYHAGDGNIHPTIFYDPTIEDDMEKLKLFLYLIIAKAIKLGGAISGEHGIGIEKNCVQNIFTAGYIYDQYEFIKKFFDENKLLNNSKLLSDKQMVDQYMIEIEKLQSKYSIQSPEDDLDIKANDKRDGLIEVDCNTIPVCKSSELVIPYFPIINTCSTWNDLFKIGVPSFLDSFYNLELIVRSVELDNGLIFGRKTLKNVEGYNLVPLHMSISDIKQATIKVISQDELKKRFYFYKVKCSYKDISSTIYSNNISSSLLDYYYLSDRHLILILSNEIKQFQNKDIEKLDVFNGENLGTYENLMIVTLKENIELDNLKYKKWIYMKRENTLMIIENSIDELANLQELRDMSYSIRSIENNKNNYLYLDSTFEKQVNLLNSLKEKI